MTRWIVVAGLFFCAAVAVALDLASPPVSAWFSAHAAVTSIGANLIFFSAAYVGLDFWLSAAARRRWRTAALPMLWQVLDKMRACHETLDNLLGELPTFPKDAPDLVRYQDVVGRYSALFATSPELGVIYANIAQHLGALELLVDVCRDGSVPSWDIAADVNDAAAVAVDSIGRYLGGAIPTPVPLQNKVPTIRDHFRGEQPTVKRGETSQVCGNLGTKLAPR
jgi:hypothetical protein